MTRAIILFLIIIGFYAGLTRLINSTRLTRIKPDEAPKLLPEERKEKDKRGKD